MEITSVSSPRNDFPGIPTRAEMFRGIWLSRNRVIEGSLSGTVVGRLFASSSAFALAVVSGPATINEDNELVLSSTAGDAGTTQTVRVSATRATPYLQIVQDLEVYADVTPFALNDLTLSSSSYFVGAAPGTVIASLVGRTSGSSLEIYPNDGRVTFDLSGNLIVGLSAASIGSYSITVRESKEGATNAPKASTLTLSVTAAAPPEFTSSYALNAGEGSDAEINVTINQSCDVTIIGGADAGLFSLSSDLNTTSAVLTMAAQTYSGVVSNDRVVTLRATSLASGLEVEQDFTVTVTDVAAPVCSSAPVIAGDAAEGTILTISSIGVWTGSVFSVSGQWHRGGVAITGATGLTYQRTLADFVAGGTITYVETALGGGGTTTQASNALAATTNGVIARVGFSAAASTPAVDRWAESHTGDTTVTARAAAGAGNYTWTVGGTVTFAGPTAGNPSPTFLNGHVSATGAGYVEFPVTPGVPIKLRFAFGITTITGVCGFIIREGAAGTIHATVATTAPIPLGSVCDHTGAIMTKSNWDANAAVLSITPGTGTIRITKGTSSLYLVAVEIVDSTFVSVTHGVGPYYVSTAGVDTALGGSVTPWKSIPGDPGAGGSLSAFTIDPSGSVLLARGQRHRPASYTARSDKHLQLITAGTAGNPVTLGATGSGADPIVDASQLQTGWSSGAAHALVTGSPDAANIEKATVTGITTYAQQVFEDDRYLAPAQFPSPSSPYNFDQAYDGTDAFLFVTPANYAATVDVQPVGSYDANTNTDPALGAIGNRIFTITDARLPAHYGSLDLTGYVLCLYMNGSRLAEFPIDSYNSATGECTLHMSNTNAGPHDYHNAGTQTPFSGYFRYCVRYHPFDIRMPGQYGYNTAKTELFAHFFNSGSVRSLPRLSYGMLINKNYLTFSNLEIARAGITVGYAIKMGATSSNLALNDVRVRQIGTMEGAWIVHFADYNYPMSNFAIDGLDIADCPRAGGIAFVKSNTGTLNNFRMRNEGKTGVYFGGLTTNAAHHITCTDIDTSDNWSAHGNGFAVYEDAHHITLDGYLGMNRPRGLSMQTTGGAATRANVIRRFIVTERRLYPTANGVVASYPYQGGANETDGLIEQGIIGGNALLFPSAGQIIRNTVVSSLITTSLTGVSFENCLIFNEVGSGKTSFTGLGVTDLGGNVFDNSDRTAPDYGWKGVITIPMQQALTRNVGGGGYTTVTLGTTANPWVVPAYGSTFTLIDLNLTTTVIKSYHRADDTFTSVLNSRPGSSIELPAGVGDNNLFALWHGQLYPIATLNSPPGTTYSITVRETNVTAANTGATTHDTVFTVTLG